MLFWMLSCNSNIPEAINSPPFDVEYNPTWNPTEVSENLHILFSLGIPNPQEIMISYMDLYDEGATNSCPGSNYNFDGSEISNYGCTADNGFFFAGTAEVRYTDEYNWELHCDCRIVAPDGRMVRGAGNLRLSVDGQGSQQEQFADLRGSFLVTHGSDWLQRLPSTTFQINFFSNFYSINGGYSIEGRSVYFENLQFRDCENGSGSIFIRDPSGGWWQFQQPSNCQSGILWFNELNYGGFEFDLSVLHEQIKMLMEVE